MLEKVLVHNKQFVESRKAKGEDKPISSHAHEDTMVFTCMDTRLVDLLEPAMGFKRGDIKILKNAGNVIRENCNDVIRSICVGTVLMDLKHVYIVGHTDCGMRKQNAEAIKEKMLKRGISKEAIESINIEDWFGLIKDEAQNVKEAVEKVKNSPFIPKDIAIHGLLMDINSGEIEVIA